MHRHTALPDQPPRGGRTSTKILVPAGVLGLGFDPAALDRGVDEAPDLIAIDGGSTDSGPHYLGTASSKYSDAVCRAEWRLLMQARHRAGVPLVIGSAGTCGADATVDAMLAMTRELAQELGHKVRIATIHSEQSNAALLQAHRSGRISPLAPALPVDSATLESCTHVVALAGAEPIMEALASGADIVIAGRTTDTAIIAALALMHGRPAGAAWHAAKIAECGALCSTHPTSGVVMVEIDGEGFDVWPLAEAARCTPRTVSAHMLYENADPYRLHEPGGLLDVEGARYDVIDERRVRVTGSRWESSNDYTVKLEGARLAGYQTSLLVLLRDPHYVKNARAWTQRLQRFLVDDVVARLGLEAAEFDIELRRIGDDAVFGDLEARESSVDDSLSNALPSRTTNAHEIGVLCLVTAPTAALAEEIGKLANPQLLHFPLTPDEPLPTFAFPYSPAQSERGALHEFCLQHVMAIDDPLAAFRIVLHETTPGTTIDSENAA